MTAFSTIGQSTYAKNAVKYIEILNKLRSMGAQSAVDLPTIVFCGNQSAGKSSLLEAISGIQLPRSEGTCTRCVMEIRLIQSVSDWSCQVSLRKEYDADGNKIIPEETKFGSIVKNPDSVELVARRAQKALLNPDCKPKKYVGWNFELSYEDDAATNALKFTRNVVCLEIKGPKVPNLSLIDLPGIIRHVEKSKDEKFIKLIEELVENYISKEKSIIVATISCKDEIDNQAIITLAKKADELGSRTLGVLTKPDTIEEGTHGSWIKIMRGDAHQLALGYYVIRNPQPIELKNGITFGQARQNELKFFEEEEPWKSFHLRERLGVKYLQDKLSELLISAIKRTLPSIKKEVEEKLENIRTELGNIPEQLGNNPRIEVYRMTKKCSNSIQEETTCSNNQTKLWQEINKELKNFKHELCSTRPIFEIGSKKFDLLKDFLTPTNQINDNQTKSPIDSQIGFFIENYRNDPQYGSIVQAVQAELPKENIITEDDVTDNINKARGRLLPGFIPYSSAVSLIMNHQKKWKSPTLDCLNKIYEIMTQHVNDSVDTTFSRFPALVGRMRHSAMLYLEECKQITEKYIDFANEIEGNNFPFTLDEGSMIMSKIEYLKDLHEAVKEEKREPSDALEIIAFSMAYFKLSFKRYADMTSMTIIHAFIDKFSKYIEEKLIEACDPVDGDDEFDLNELVKEDEGISRRRENLRENERHLRSMLTSLVRFGC